MSGIELTYNMVAVGGPVFAGAAVYVALWVVDRWDG